MHEQLGVTAPTSVADISAVLSGTAVDLMLSLATAEFLARQVAADSPGTFGRLLNLNASREVEGS